ncbi:MAG: YbjN domain-containing protein [Pseudomonadota bacterium]
MNMRTLMAAGAALLLVPTCAVQAQEYEAGKVIKNFDAETLEAVVKSLKGEIEPTDDGRYKIKFANGITSIVKFGACGSGKCLGTNIQANFSKPSAKTPTQMAVMVRDFNKSRAAAKIIWAESGNTGVQGYFIADSGTTMANYRAQINLHAYIAKLWADTIYPKKEGS